jgi:hypothetical protein
VSKFEGGHLPGSEFGQFCERRVRRTDEIGMRCAERSGVVATNPTWTYWHWSNQNDLGTHLLVKTPPIFMRSDQIEQTLLAAARNCEIF